MGLSGLYRKFALSSPRTEVLLRKAYWAMMPLLHKFVASEGGSNNSTQDAGVEHTADFSKVIAYLRELGIKKGDIVIVHSSFDSLRATGLDSEGVINALLELVGEEGTLAMPAIRHFPEEGEGIDYLKKYIKDDVPGDVVYDLYRTPISSGLLPFTLSRYDDAVISEFPLNPLVAVGAHAEEMMQGNIDGTLPSAHGAMSAWKYCADHNAWNIGIGVSEKDYLTIFHVGQEQPEWPYKEDAWYLERNFSIKKGRNKTPLRIRERRHRWTMFFPEINFYNDLKENSILSQSIVEGIEVLAVRSSELFDFIAKQPDGYPYLIPRKYHK